MKTHTTHHTASGQVARSGKITPEAHFLSERERRLVQFALDMGNLRSERVQQLASDCQRHGFTPTELLEVALMAVKEIDLPAALTWVNDGLEGINPK